MSSDPTTAETPGRVTVTETIAAPATRLYDMVSDVTRMGDWSPETVAGKWVGGVAGPSVGARFRGRNRSGWRRWSTACTVVAADPGERFSFEVKAVGAKVSRWTYTFEPAGDGCRVTETWEDARAGWMVRVSPTVTGVSDRAGHNRDGMRATLAKLRAAAEAPS